LIAAIVNAALSKSKAYNQDCRWPAIYPISDSDVSVEAGFGA